MARANYDLDDLILDFIKRNPLRSSKEIHDGLGGIIGYATIKRAINDLQIKKLIASTGRGKGTKYEISASYNIIHEIDVDWYFQKEIDERVIMDYFNYNLISETLTNVTVFTEEENKHLTELQNQYKKNIATLSESAFKKELERLAIDLSWKSSQIEGNTYSLLETERLLKEKQTASGKTKDEATMLLNHKEALDFIVSDPNYVTPLSLSSIEDIHGILIQELDIDRNIRKRRVGISGTNYQPLDNEFQIREALVDLCNLVNSQENIFAKALFVLVLISYIQAFADGNKRKARIISNAILIHYNYCPISFRTVDSVEYKKAMLIFYEQNNISAFKKIFISQFEFAVKTYF